jgi:hypothetical protein
MAMPFIVPDDATKKHRVEFTEMRYRSVNTSALQERNVAATVHLHINEDILK